VAPELFKGETPSSACDIYSFAILTVYLLNNGKEPYHFSSIQELIHRVCEGYRPEEPSILSKILIKLINEWWSKRPDRRTAFASEDDAIWNTIMEEVKTHGQTEVVYFWNENFKKYNEVLTEVDWIQFSTHFSNYLQIQDTNFTNPEWKCLRVLLDAFPDKLVTKNNFLRLVDWFGPVRVGKKEGAAFLHQFELLFKTEWFHGNIGKQEAERRLNISKKEKIFLVRFSTKQSTYAMTCKKKGIYHIRSIEGMDIQSLIGWVDKESKIRSLKPCSIGRSMSHLLEPGDVPPGIYEALL